MRWEYSSGIFKTSDSKRTCLQFGKCYSSFNFSTQVYFAHFMGKIWILKPKSQIWKNIPNQRTKNPLFRYPAWCWLIWISWSVTHFGERNHFTELEARPFNWRLVFVWKYYTLTRIVNTSVYEALHRVLGNVFYLSHPYTGCYEMCSTFLTPTPSLPTAPSVPRSKTRTIVFNTYFLLLEHVTFALHIDINLSSRTSKMGFELLNLFLRFHRRLRRVTFEIP